MTKEVLARRVLDLKPSGIRNFCTLPLPWRM